MNFNRIALGTWQLAGPVYKDASNIGWNFIEEDKAINIIKSAIDMGIDFFDTAEAYGNGKSEALLGKVIGNNYNVKVCSKYGFYEKDGTIYRDFTAERLETALHQSLQRLNRDYLDYYLLHGATLNEITEELIAELLRLKKLGLIKKIGLSATFLEPYQNYFDVFDCFEVVYNEITTNNLQYLPQLSHKEIFARSVFASGLLLKTAEELSPDKYTDWRSQLHPDIFEKARNYVLQNINNSSKTLIEKALSHPFSRIIIGVNDISQLSFG